MKEEEVEDEEDYVALNENLFNFTNFITNTYIQFSCVHVKRNF